MNVIASVIREAISNSRAKDCFVANNAPRNDNAAFILLSSSFILYFAASRG